MTVTPRYLIFNIAVMFCRLTVLLAMGNHFLLDQSKSAKRTSTLSLIRLVVPLKPLNKKVKKNNIFDHPTFISKIRGKK